MRLPNYLLIFYLIVFGVCGISPYDRGVWVAENIPIILLVGVLIVISKYHTYSKMSCWLMLFLPVLHTIGGHFTFERVPFNLVTEFFEFERNHYDRIAHFSVGFYAYPIAEYVKERSLILSKPLAGLFAITCIFTVASLYEIFEWWYALSASAEAGLAVLGSQGDIWDAQKDMLADGSGAVFVIIIYFIQSNRKNSQRQST